MMCCATGLPVPDWVRGMCAPVPRSSTHTTGVLLVLNQRRTGAKPDGLKTDDGDRFRWISKIHIRVL